MASYSENTQICDISTFDARNIVFGKPQENNITLADSKKIRYFRVNIGYKNPDGTTGDLILRTEKLFSYGIQENKNPNNGKVDGFSMALCLWDRDGATPSQSKFVSVFEKAMDAAKEHIVQVKDEVEKYDLEANDLKHFSPLYWKREKGVKVPGKGPTLYPKLLVSKKEDPPLIRSSFYFDHNDQDVNPREIIGKYCHVEAAIKIESIFVGSKVSPQVKLQEACIRLASEKPKRLLRPQRPKLLSSSVAEALGTDTVEEDDESVNGSIASESDGENDDEAAVTEAVVKKKRVVRKVVRRKKV